MAFRDPDIMHRTVDDMLVASIRIRGTANEAREHLKTLCAECEGSVSGPPFCLYRYGTSAEPGNDIEVCVPLSKAVETNKAEVRMLEGFGALSIRHHGSYDNLGESYQRLWKTVMALGLPGDMFEREIYLVKGETPDENVTEIQVALHSWSELLAESVERVLGTEARNEVVQDLESISPMAGPESRARWIQAAVSRLDVLADHDQRYDILSSCAHVFPQERIAHLRSVYLRNRDVDEVLTEMHKDPGWYADPVRKGDVIYVEKKPFDLDGYRSATTEVERRRAFCHCAMVREYLEDMSPTFCHCGTGWYRRPWEGILQQPVRVDLVQSLLKGDDTCQVAIHLPDGV